MTPQQAFRLPHFAQRRQQGQALTYGIFVLMGGLAALLFVFNTGQLTAEKNKLVNTADAVAYSAAVMQARALNFDAYTNRAPMANEVMLAQAVSIAAWSTHVVRHTENIAPLNCRSYYSVPAALVLIDYIPVCYLLSLPIARHTAQAVDKVAQQAAQASVLASEAAIALFCTACAAPRSQDGPGMIATFSNGIKGKKVDLLRARTANGERYIFPIPGSLGPDKNPMTGGATIGTAPNGRELPQWVEFEWKVWPYPYPAMPAEPVALQAWSDGVHAMSRALRIQTAGLCQQELFDRKAADQ
jgi:hypothetical protein